MQVLRALAALTALAVTVVAMVVGPSVPDRSVAHVPEPGGGFAQERLSSGASPQAFAAALGQAEATPSSPLASLHPWQDRGPVATGGRITDLVIDHDRGAVFIASASGGVWRSDDGGATLRPSWPADATPAVGALALTADGVLLAGTGEANAGGGSITFTGTGLYRSTDGGATWQPAGLPESGTIARIATHPTDPQVAWVAAGGDLFTPGGQRGIYRTGDGGTTWDLVLPGATPTTGGADLAVDPANPDHLLAATWDRQRTPDLRRYGGIGSGLHVSTDGGRTWTPVTDGIPGFTADAGRIAVALSPADPDVGYAVVTRGDGRGDGLYRSDDGGRSWRLVNDSDLYLGSQFIFGWWFSKVFAAPDDADRVLVPGLTLLESTDGGATFATDPRVHADQHALVWDPRDPATAWLASDGGLYTSHEGGRSLTWVAATAQPFTQAYDVAVPPADPDRVAGGFQDNGCMLGTSGQPWQGTGGCGDGLVVLPHPDRPDEAVVCGQYGRCAITTTWSRGTRRLITPPVDRAGWGAPLVRAPGDPDVLLFGGNTLHRSEDAGATWQQVSGDLTRGRSPDRDYPYGTISEVHPVDDLATDVVVGTDDGLVHRTTDGGRTWTLLLDGDRWITGIAAADGGRTLLVGTSGYFAGDGTAQVRRSTDGGTTWQDIADGLPDAPVNDVLVAGAAVVVATDVGAYGSWDALTATTPRWRRLGTTLPQAPVLALDHHLSTGLLTAGTFGRGIWQTILPTVSRHAGDDRYATAATILRGTLEGTGTAVAAEPVTTLVLVSGADFPDAVTAGALVARRPGWALALTAPEDLPAPTAALLTDLAPDQVVLVGGPAAIGEAVAAQVRDITGAQPHRVEGGDRYATAAALAGMQGADTGTGGTVLLATAGSPFDALAAAALAAAADAPLLLVDRDRLPPTTRDALAANAPTAVVALGGTAAVGDAVLQEAAAVAGGADTGRIAGADRVATAAAIAAEVARLLGVETPGSPGDSPLDPADAIAPRPGVPGVWIAAAGAYPDALAAAATGAPVLLTTDGGLPDATVAALRLLRPTQVAVAGGTAVVSDATLDALRYGAG